MINSRLLRIKKNSHQKKKSTPKEHQRNRNYNQHNEYVKHDISYQVTNSKNKKKSTRKTNNYVDIDEYIKGANDIVNYGLGNAKTNSSALDTVKKCKPPRLNTHRSYFFCANKKNKYILLKQLSTYISRISMEHPRKSNALLLRYMHQCIGSAFGGYNDEAIEWLLGGTNGMEVGGFDNASAFQSFFNDSPRDIPLSDLSTGIESVLTATGYRMINAPWSAQPVDPSQLPGCAKEIQKIHKFIMQLRDIYGKLPCPISEVYGHRIYEVTDAPYSELTVYDAPDFDSLDFMNKRKPLNPPSKRSFKNLNGYYENPKPWPNRCLEHSIPINAHVSGTAPLTLSAMDALLEYYMGLDAKIISTDFKIQLAGTLILATYERADYHSIVESMSGIVHWVMDTSVPGSSVEQCPKKMYKEGMLLLAQSCDKSIRPYLIDIINKELDHLMEEHHTSLPSIKGIKN